MDRERIREAISEIDRIIEDLRGLARMLEAMNDKAGKAISEMLMRKVNEINVLLGYIESELGKG